MARPCTGRAPDTGESHRWEPTHDGRPGAHARPAGDRRAVRRVLRQGVPAVGGPRGRAARLRPRRCGPSSSSSARRAWARPRPPVAAAHRSATSSWWPRPLGRAIAPVPFRRPPGRAAACSTTPTWSPGEAVATVSLRPADADGSWRLVPAGAVADVVVGVDGDDLVAVRRPPPRPARATTPSVPRSPTAPPARASAPCSARPSAFGPVLDRGRCSPPRRSSASPTRRCAIGVAYVKERHQFGVPIGSFQAVQHGLADLPVLIDGGRLLAHKAAWAVDRRHRPRSTSAPSSTSPTLGARVDGVRVRRRRRRHATDRCLHFHGGYGFAEEYDIQLYYRRARGWALVAGRPADGVPGLADRLFGAGGGLSRWTSPSPRDVEPTATRCAPSSPRPSRPRSSTASTPPARSTSPELNRALGREGFLERAVPGLGKGDPIELWMLFHELEKAGAPLDGLGSGADDRRRRARRRHRRAEGPDPPAITSRASRWCAWATASPTSAPTSRRSPPGPCATATSG